MIGKPAEAERDAALRLDPGAAVIGAAVDQAVAHGVHQPRGRAGIRKSRGGEKAGDAAHVAPEPAPAALRRPAEGPGQTGQAVTIPRNGFNHRACRMS